MKIYRHFIKPIADFLSAFFLLLLLFPVILTVIIFLFFANNGRIFFIQQRPGWNEIPFNIIKFKTMNDNQDDQGNLLPDELRLTRIGKLIRSTSIDEILQLVNVLKGDMSIVGPRPLLMEYLPLYSEFQRKRHQVRPGITGWAQVNGRNSIPWEKKFQLDVEYVENQSFFLDFKILGLTIIRIFQRKGINSNTSITMEKFKGNNNHK